MQMFARIIAGIPNVSVLRNGRSLGQAKQLQNPEVQRDKAAHCYIRESQRLQLVKRPAAKEPEERESNVAANRRGHGRAASEPP